MLAAQLPLIVHSSILLSLIALLFGVAIGVVFLLISMKQQAWEEPADSDEAKTAIDTP